MLGRTGHALQKHTYVNLLSLLLLLLKVGCPVLKHSGGQELYVVGLRGRLQVGTS